MMKAPLRPGTRPVGVAQLAVKDTSTNGPVFAATPKGDGPRPQDWRGGMYARKSVLMTLNGTCRHPSGVTGSAGAPKGAT
jgi:hypothetical protein